MQTPVFDAVVTKTWGYFFYWATLYSISHNDRSDCNNEQQSL